MGGGGGVGATPSASKDDPTVPVRQIKPNATARTARTTSNNQRVFLFIRVLLGFSRCGENAADYNGGWRTGDELRGIACKTEQNGTRVILRTIERASEKRTQSRHFAKAQHETPRCIARSRLESCW